MPDRISCHHWALLDPPAGSGIWPRFTGHLIGCKDSSFRSTPTYFGPHLVTRGSGTVETSAGTWTVRRGDLFTLWPGVRIHYHTDPSDPWEYYWLNLHGSGIEAYIRACGFSPTQVSFRARRPAPAIRLFRAIHQHFGQQRAQDQAVILASLYQLVTACAPPQPPQLTTDSRSALVARALAIVDEVGHVDLGVAGLAKSLGVDRSTLFRAFAECLGKTPKDHIDHTRIVRAKGLLMTTRDKLSVIARASGFNSESYFLRCFRLATGETPAAFRRAGKWRS